MQAQADSPIWSNPLVRHLAVVLAVKLVLLTALWWAFFRVPEHALPQQSDIAAHIAGPAAQAGPTLSD
ncbi:cation/multidrug efflux pump [Thiohalobacter thiocyanaticus]|uniref:Cation/multidrug efflux pump n=1 Tax=Thiohalobacter thiocyanaticus TaxID=585455 RepID=A0A1Z4VPH1_9GAMM|nr:cytochrome oxidase putative small subunit CydP [Thiohalobacter thiocyanaticus]BAZ93507.1 cation/multidrug efflux pump [Thiohalobacter thiocyanaticus]